MRFPTILPCLCASSALSLFACGGSEPPKSPAPAASATSAAAKGAPPESPAASFAPGSAADPFPPASPSVAWFVLDWDTNADAAEAALKKAGLGSKRTPNEKGGFATVATERGDWSATLYFNLAGTAMFQIVTTNSSASNEIGEAAQSRLTARFGTPSSSARGVENVWRRDGGPVVTVKTRATGGKVSLLEEWIREDAKGPVGFASLDWDMPPPKLKPALKSAGFEAADVKSGSMHFQQKGREGDATFSSAGALTQIVVRADALRDEGEATTRIEELKKSFGRGPTMVIKESSAHWSAPAIEADLSIQEKMPGAAWTVRETYKPRKKL